MAELQEDLKDIATLQVDLASFFCEDPQTFSLEESLRIMNTFCERFKKSIEVSYCC